MSVLLLSVVRKGFPAQKEISGLESPLLAQIAQRCVGDYQHFQNLCEIKRRMEMNTKMASVIVLGLIVLAALIFIVGAIMTPPEVVETPELVEAETRFESGTIEVATIAYLDDEHALSQLPWVENALYKAFVFGESATYVTKEIEGDKVFIHNVVVINIDVQGYRSTLALKMARDAGVIVYVPCNEWTLEMTKEHVCTEIPNDLLSDYMKKAVDGGAFTLGWVEFQRFKPTSELTSEIGFKALVYYSVNYVKRFR